MTPLEQRGATARRRLARAGGRERRTGEALTQRAESIRLELNPDLAAYRAECLEAAAVAAESRRLQAGKRHASGWHRGQPQCPGCRQILATKNGWCPDCRTYGDSGHYHAH